MQKIKNFGFLRDDFEAKEITSFSNEDWERIGV